MTTGSPTGPGRPKSFDRAEALDAAMKVFWKQGYEATSVGDLLDATGLSRSSFYDSFGSKRDLLLAAVQHYCDTNGETVIEIIADMASPRKSIHDMLMLIANGGGEQGCLLVNCITELAPHDAQVRAIAHDHGERLEEILVTLILQERDGRKPATAKMQAQALISLAYGATLMRKSGMDEAAVLKLLKTGETMLN